MRKQWLPDSSTSVPPRRAPLASMSPPFGRARAPAEFNVLSPQAFHGDEPASIQARRFFIRLTMATASSDTQFCYPFRHTKSAGAAFAHSMLEQNHGYVVGVFLLACSMGSKGAKRTEKEQEILSGENIRWEGIFFRLEQPGLGIRKDVLSEYLFMFPPKGCKT